MNRNAYDSTHREIHLRSDASPYQIAHELSHACQHLERNWCWRVWVFARHLPLLWWPALLLLELDALLKARRALAADWHEHSKEAWRLYRTYLTPWDSDHP